MLARMITEKVTFGQNPESVRELEIWLERSMQREHPVNALIQKQSQRSSRLSPEAGVAAVE